MDVASGCGEQEVGVASGSGWNLWVWLVGVVVRRYIYRFPHITYPYSSCICSFLQQDPYFLFIFGILYMYRWDNFKWCKLSHISNGQKMCEN